MVVDNIDQALIASAQVAALDRRKVRRRFEERFTAHRMANDYVRVYRKLVHHTVEPLRDVKYPLNRAEEPVKTNGSVACMPD
jgi:hypothetical protein